MAFDWLRFLWHRGRDEDGLIDADTKHVCTNKDLWPVRPSLPVTAKWPPICGIRILAPLTLPTQP